MANVLRMDKQQQIRALLELNWSYRAIKKETGIRRETVSKYDHRKTAKVPTDEEAKPASCPPNSRSGAAGFSIEIAAGLKKGH